MLTIERRGFLASLGTIAISGLAGCSLLQSESPPAGSLRFVNNSNLPHSITVRVTDVGAYIGEQSNSPEGDVAVPPIQRNLTASTTVSPDDRQTYEGVFTSSVWYAVQFVVDGREPENETGIVTFHPAPPNREYGTFLSGRIHEYGEFSWAITSTENAGSFTFNNTGER